MRPSHIAELAWSLSRATRSRLREVRTYLALRRSGKFDRAFYLAAYPEVAEAGADPLRDYVEHGWRAGRDPSPQFSTRAYLNARPDVEAAGVNPLLHSLRYGDGTDGAGRLRGVAGAALRAARRPGSLGPRSLRASLRALRRRRPGDDPAREQRWPRGVTVIVPIHNAPDDLERCLDALVRNTGGPARLLLIDDASPDSRIAELTARFEGLPDVEILRNPENLGYTRTINRAIAHARGDVVLLNSDTEVTPRWLERLSRAAATDPSIGTVTAISNHAGAFSVPQIAVDNPLPQGLTKDDVGRLVAHTSSHLLPQTPTGSGFCLYVKRALLDDVGPFDAESFPRGYGEENDFCVRALKRGWRHVVDDATFVHHRREASFGAEKAQILPGARARVSELHPEYDGLVRDFLRSEDMRRVRENVRRAFDAGQAQDIRPRRRILFVLHEGGGGTIETSRDLLGGLGHDYEPYLLTSDTRTVRLSRRSAGELVELRSWRLDRPWQPTDFSRPDFRAIAREVLSRWEIELVHVRHLMKQSFDLPHVAAELGVPVVVSFHDYYLSCPTVHLLDDQDRYCGGLCTAGDGECRIPSPLLRSLPPLKHRYVHRWRAEVTTMLETASAAVTTSPHARDVHLRSLPSLRRKRFEVIPHGRDLDQRHGLAVAPEGRQPMRILVAGNLDVHKGADYIRALRAADEGDRLEFHFLGTVPDEYAGLGTVHGPYARSSFAERVGEIGPAFVGIFSIWAETYNHILTEGWAAGVPVLVTDIGALGERVREHGGGWALPVGDPRTAYARILEIAGDPAAYRREAERATAAGLPSVAAMARAYEELYDSVLESHRAFAPRGGAAVRDGVPRPPRARVGGLELAAFVPGGGGHYPGSTHVRVLRRLAHPTIRPRVGAELVTRDRPARLPPSADLALVQRTAIAPEATSRFIAEVRSRRVPLVVELDDDLLGEDLADPLYGAHRESLSALLEAADLVTVTTEVLREALEGRAERIAVVPNMLDERLWLADLDSDDTPEHAATAATRLMYVGSTTHAQDLALLRPVLEHLRSEFGLDVELSVVGGEPTTTGASWYRRVPVPRGWSAYPRFVEWLRGERSRWDVAVGPLADTTFNRSKSDLKFLEYSALGLPGVFSDVPAFATVVDGVTGLRAENTVESWTAALAKLCTDVGLRGRLREAAQTYVFTERCIGHSADDYLDLLCGLLVDEGAPRADPAESLGTVPAGRG